MSFLFSSGTMDSMGGVFAPSKGRTKGGGGGSGKGKGGTILAMAIASTIAPASRHSQPSSSTKAAFGSGGASRQTGRAIGVADRTARRVPEVMVRITGRQNGGGHVLANFSYISRLGHGGDKEVPLYTSDGDILHDGKSMQILAQDWHEWESGDNARRSGATSISMILSMPAGVDPIKLRDAALDFAKDEMANRSWVGALHVDRDHPHFHLTIARRDHDGRRFHPNRDDLFRYRQRFAEKLREHGIEANATPCKARAVDAKHEHIGVKKMREKGQKPRIDKNRAARAERVSKQPGGDPVAQHLRAQQATVKSVYQRSIAELQGSNNPEHREVASSLSKFIATLPDIEVNSTKRAGVIEREAGQSPLTLPLAKGDLAVADPVAAALARAQAVRAQIVDSHQRSKQEQAESENGESAIERLRRLADQARSGVADVPDGPSIDDAVNQVNQQEQERARRERDRYRDRDGPGR